MDYTALQAYVVSQLHRTSASMDTMVPTFIELARLRIGRDVRAYANLKTGTVTSFSSEATALPTDLGRLRTVMVDGVALASITTEQLGDWQNAGNMSVYAVQAQDLVIPGSGSTTIATLEYWSIPAALSGGTDVSAGMAEWPNIWSQAALMEAALWERDWDTYGQVQALYQAEVGAINSACQEALFGNAPAIVSDQPMIQSAGWL